MTSQFEAHPIAFYMMNSVMIGLGTAALSVAVAAMVAYALARFSFKGRMGLAYRILSLRALPPIAIILSYFILFARLDLVDTHFALIIAHTVNQPSTCNLASHELYGRYSKGS